MASHPPSLCQGCGERLSPDDEVRQLHRHLAAAPGGDEATYPMVAYSHLGHEPNHGYRITGRGTLRSLEAERVRPETD